MTREDIKDFLVFIILLVIAIPITYLIDACADKYHENHPTQYDTYEIVIIDKYDDIGSTWHIIGGRASETEYHIHYKYRNKTKNTEWYELTSNVSGTEYRQYNVGDKFEKKLIEDCRLAPL